MNHTIDLHQLAGIDTRPHHTLSLYLALDASREGRLQALAQMVKSKEQQLSGNGSVKIWKSLQPDVELLTRYVEELPLGPDRGLALFTCSAQGVFSAHTLSLVVPNMMELGPAPYIRPLAALAGDHCHTLVVVLDKRRARFFDSFLGHLVERTDLELINEAVPVERDGGQGRAGDKRASRRAEEAVSRLFKETNQSIAEVFEDKKYQQLMVGGAKGALDAYLGQLPAFLADRLGGSFNCDAGATISQVSQEVAMAQPAARRVRQERLLAILADNLGPSGQAATGLNQVLAALHAGQVHTLFVRRGYTAAGGSCPSCSRLRHVAGKCPLCSEEMTPVSDVVNMAVARAIESGATLEQIEGDSKLDELDEIAALLRYA
jgi:peptide chain release factor subunit 1